MMSSSVNIRILKGANEIGGSCVEISTPKTTILIDYGTPLSEDSPKIKQFPSKIDAILISHPHQDHFGEIVTIDDNVVPIYCGSLTHNLMNATYLFTGRDFLQHNFQFFEKYKSFYIGDFKITPYLVDHSAVDSYAFLIETFGYKIIYTGDFRSNGRKSILFDNMLNNANLKSADVVLMEGTMLRRDNGDFPTERQVEEKIYQTLKDTKDLTFMIASSQNIDSLVSAFRACKKTNKFFVIDIYTAWILDLVSTVGSVPNVDWEQVKVLTKYGSSHYQKLKDNQEYFKNFGNSFNSRVFQNTVELDELKLNPQNYFIKISPKRINDLMKELKFENVNIIYSMWLGYLKEEFSDSESVLMYENLQQKYNWVYAHTSGHADLDTLKRFAGFLSPKALIPIHTEHKDKFAEHFDNVLVLDDNDYYNIGSQQVKKLERNIK